MAALILFLLYFQGVLLLGCYPPTPFRSLGVLTRLTVSLEELPHLSIQIQSLAVMQALTTNAKLAKDHPDPNPQGVFL